MRPPFSLELPFVRAGLVDMARVYDNWERLVRATLKWEQLRSSSQGQERVPSGIAGAVP
ncbi:hypothetical protein GBA52_017493 [Prunus armeniaca]|nr:hypothetical protein GBA52_017493 [Prunus armeniaca]